MSGLRNKVLMVLVAGIVAALAGTAGEAALISYEGFDYTLSQGLSGLNGGLGWGGNTWGAAATYSVSPGLSLSDYPVLGNAVQIDYPNSNNSQELANRQVASTAGPATLWTSYLYQPEVTLNGNYNGLQVNASTTNVGAGVLRSANRGWGNARGGVAADNGITFGTQDFIDGTTYLVISKFTGLNTNSVTGKWWSLRGSEYDAVKGGGITEAELDATHYDTATDSASFGSPLSFDTSKYVQMQFVTQTGTSQSVTYDELRHATELADLFGAPVIGPPSESRFVQIDFTNGTSPAGWNQAGINTAIGNLLDTDGNLTGISMSTLNEFGWVWNQGPNSDQTAPNGVVFPAAVSYRNAADNEAGSRDSWASIRLSSPTEYEYDLTFMAAFTTVPGVTQFNIGGTWNSATMSFDGGTTVEIDPDVNNATDKFGLLSALGQWDATANAYVLDLQIGNKTGGITVGGLNGLHVGFAAPATPIPEPSTFVLGALGLLGLGFVGWRKRERK